MRVLAGRGHTHGAGPVVVEVRQLVRQLLEVLRLEAAGVLQHVVAGGIDGALPDALADQEEVVPGKTMSCQTGKLPSYLSGRVTTSSTTVPLGGFSGLAPALKNLVLILLLTTTYVNFSSSFTSPAFLKHS